MSLLVVSPAASGKLPPLPIKGRHKVYLDTYKTGWLAQGSPDFAKTLKSFLDREMEVIDVAADAESLRRRLGTLADQVFISRQTDISPLLSRPGISPRVYADEPEKQEQLKAVHEEIYGVLSDLCNRYNCRLLFVGSSFAGMKIPENFADLDYRILVPEGKSLRKMGQAFARAYPRLDYNDEVSTEDMSKYDIDFDLGKADVSFVPAATWRGKVDASQLTPFLPDDLRSSLLQQKRQAFQQGADNYKAAKTAVANRTLGHFGIEPQRYQEGRRYFMDYSFNRWLLWREAIDLNQQSLTLYHGCSTSNAQNIMAHGLQNRSEFDPTTNMAGEFWATTNYAYASLMSFMPGYSEPSPDDPPVVLQFMLPIAALRRMREGKHYNEHGEGAYEFRSPSFKFLNGQIHGWKEMPLEGSAAQKWAAEVAKMQPAGAVA
jgi:hypothetical protein